MCGILVHIRKIKNSQSTDGNTHRGYISSPMIEEVYRRGPDSQRDKTLNTDTHLLCLYSSVLHMRGRLVTQPLDYHSNTVFMFNGEIFDGIQVDKSENDGEKLYELLHNAETPKQIINLLCHIQGPYAFLLYKADSGDLWFGRDVLGRRSLTYTVSDDALYLSSVVPQHFSTESELTELNWYELPATGIYKISLTSNTVSLTDVEFYPWSHLDIDNCTYTDLNLIRKDKISHKAMNKLNTTVPEDSLYSADLLSSDLTPALKIFSNHITEFKNCLLSALSRRVGDNSYFCNNCVQKMECTNSHIAILFSGGIDSMMLAHLTDKLLPIAHSIDLLNVAFQTPRCDGFEVPDRITGRNALTELNPRRKWRFVEINVTKEELQRTRRERIGQLIKPLNTVIDDSIGCALWFAARGQGVVRSSHNETGSEKVDSYTSISRVLLSGLGADEQLGGYSRHKASYTERGIAGLINELNLDIQRISYRNMGRDDRIISDHGKEVRFPFLDEQLVSYLNSLPVQQKMDLSLPRGKGDKLLLRLLALQEGLLQTAYLEKRAIQFGSRIAKCENSRENGSDKCDRLNKKMLMKS